MAALVGEVLRADIYWRSQSWPLAAAATKRALRQTSTEVPLGPFASRQILRLAVALALARDRNALKRARERYAAAMQGSDDRDAFELFTDIVDRDNLSFRELPAALAQVGNFEAFMSTYRERLRGGALSAIN